LAQVRKWHWNEDSVMRQLAMRHWPLLALLAAADDLGAAVTTVRAARAAEQESSFEMAEAFHAFTSWCAEAMERRDQVHADSVEDEDQLRLLELSQHGFEAQANAEVEGYRKQSAEAQRAQQDTLAQMAKEQQKFEEDSAARLATNATLVKAITTISTRLGGTALATIRKSLSTQRTPGLDVVVGTLKSILDSVIAEEEAHAETLAKSLEGYHDFLATNDEKVKKLEAAKRGWKFQAMGAAAKLVQYDHMWELISALDDAEQRMSTDLRALCRGAAVDAAAANATYDRLDTRLAQLEQGIEALQQPAGAALWTARARPARTKNALVRVASARASKGPAEAAEVLRHVQPKESSAAWERLARTVEARGTGSGKRLLTALGTALAARGSVAGEDDTACVEVGKADAKIRAINSEFDALLAQNTTAGAGLDGVQMKLARVEACVGRGDRRELAAATADVETAIAAAQASLNDTRTEVGEAGDLIANYSKENANQPEAAALAVSVDGVRKAAQAMMDADALKETRSTNATLVGTIGKEYAVWDGMLAEMRSEEAALQTQIAELSGQLEAVQQSWQDARDALKAAEDACEQQAVLWTQRTAHSTVERLVLQMATQALEAPAPRAAPAQRTGPPKLRR